MIKNNKLIINHKGSKTLNNTLYTESNSFTPIEYLPFHLMSMEDIDKIVNNNLDVFIDNDQSRTKINTNQSEYPKEYELASLKQFTEEWFNNSLNISEQEKKEYARDKIAELKLLQFSNGMPVIQKNSTYGFILYSNKSTSFVDDMGHNFGDNLSEIKKNCKLINCIFIQKNIKLDENIKKIN